MSLTKVDNGDGGARVWANTDPGIKLFGRDIPVASTSIYEPSEEIPTVLNVQPCSQQDVLWEAPNPEEEGEHIELVSNEFGSSSSSNDGCEEVGPIPSQKAVGGLQNLVRAPLCTETSMAKREDAQGQAAHEKMPKKPVKPVPCPRCESLDTKFCYFNNYNVNQPRHFCRKCQRYWTAGGTLRNVPVGAGRRKNKHSVSHQKHIVVPDTIRVRSDPGDMAHQRCSSAISTPVGIPSNQLKSGYSQHPRLHMLSLEPYAVPSLDSPSTKRTTPSFGQESPLCRSMAATMLNMQGCTAVQNHRKFNGQNISPTDGKVGVEGKLSLEHEPPVQSSISIPTHKSHNAPTVSSVKVLSADNLTSGSPVTTHQLVAAAVVSQQDEHKVNAGGDGHAVQAKDAGFSNFGGTWQFGSNMAWNNPVNTGAASNLDREALTLPPPNLLACNGAPGGLWTSLPWPLINPAMWGPPPLEWTGCWNMPWGPAAAAAAAAVMQNSGLRSTVRKHQLESSQSEGCLWVPKTLRIGDPVDAARSSIWTTLGLGDGPASSPVGGATKAFQIKSETKDRDESTTPKWHTNPAAFSRSAAFNENG